LSSCSIVMNGTWMDFICGSEVEKMEWRE